MYMFEPISSMFLLYEFRKVALSLTPSLFRFTLKVRASNLQDLVYKNGQGGITKATVSITFDNSNKSQSPLGFETHDEITVTRQVRTNPQDFQHLGSFFYFNHKVSVSQVVIGGRNKYLINGVNATNTRVQDLFCSVGLNVNNPHFLIMQVSLTSFTFYSVKVQFVSML